MARRNHRSQHQGRLRSRRTKQTGGGYSCVTDFIRGWRASAGKNVNAFVPLMFELGQAFQIDWSEEGLVMGGIFYRMQDMARPAS